MVLISFSVRTSIATWLALLSSDQLLEFRQKSPQRSLHRVHLLLEPGLVQGIKLNEQLRAERASALQRVTGLKSADWCGVACS